MSTVPSLKSKAFPETEQWVSPDTEFKDEEGADPDDPAETNRNLGV